MTDINATVTQLPDINVSLDIVGSTTLNGINDVEVSNPQNNDHFIYNSTTERWENNPSSANIFWGDITGTLSNQTDLNTALGLKADDSDLTSHTGDGTIHFIQSAISISASQISDFDTEVSNNSSVTTNTAKVTNATHTGDVTGATSLTIGTDKVLDSHINWGTGATQVSTADVPEQTNLYYTESRVTANTNVSSNTTHRSSDGSDHTFINQNVTTTGTPTFGITTLGDSSQLATSAAPTVDADIANKKYVDDNSGGATEGTAVLSTGEVGGIKFLREDGDGTSSWQIPSGSGDVVGPGVAVDENITVFDSTTGKLIKDSGTNISAVTDNTAKVTNANHTGDVTGDTALTLDKTAVTGQTTVTAVGTDFVLISDTTDTGNLKKALISDFASAGGDMAAAVYDPTTVVGDAFAMDNMAEGTTTKILTNTERTAISNNTAKVTNATHTGDVTGDTTLTIANDAVDIVMLSATGTPSSSTFLRGDNTWNTPAGGGDVTKVGTPLDDQLGVWTGDGTIEGTTGLTYDGSILDVEGNLSLSGDTIQLNSTDFISAFNTTSTRVGVSAGSVGTTNTFIGRQAGDANTANQVTAIGYFAGGSNTQNALVAIGDNAGFENTGTGMVAIGVQAGFQNTGNDSTFIGDSAGQSNPDDRVTAVGFKAGQSQSGQRNSFFGYNSGWTNSGEFSTGVGAFTLQQNTGNRNTAIGYAAGFTNTGSDCIFLGYSAGNANTDNNVFILKQDPVNTTPLMQGLFDSVTANQRMTFNADVGIGVAVPTAALDIVGDIKLTGTVDGIDIATDVAANTSKITNATHTGDVTGDTALTLDKTAVTGQSTVTAVGTDFVLISDTGDTGNLKKALISDFASAGGDMAAATYDPASIAEQLVGLTATQTLTNKTLTTPTITLKQGLTPTPTAEGDIQWDTDGNQLIIGDGTGAKIFSDDTIVEARANHTGTQTASTISDFDSSVSGNSDVTSNTAKVTNVSTNLSEGTNTNTTVDVNSSDGTNATLVSASTTRAGLLTKAKWDEIVVNNAKVTNANHTGDVTGATVLTIGVDKVKDTMIDFGTGANQVSTADLPEQTNLYYTESRVTANSSVTANTAKVTNVSTNLSAGPRTATTMDVDSSDGTDATLVEADTTNAGILGSGKWDEIVANTLKATNVSTNLSEGTSTETTVDVNSSDGTNATLVSASATRAGVLTKAKFDEIVVNNAKTGVTSEISNVVEDTTPQLGGDLDLNDKGFTRELTAATANSFVAGELGFFASGGVTKADASAESTSKGLLVMATETISATTTGTFFIIGTFTTTGLTAGAEFYISETAGAFTSTKPTTTGTIVRIIGYAISTTELIFQPDNTYIEN